MQKRLKKMPSCVLISCTRKSLLKQHVGNALSCTRCIQVKKDFDLSPNGFQRFLKWLLPRPPSCLCRKWCNCCKYIHFKPPHLFFLPPNEVGVKASCLRLCVLGLGVKKTCVKKYKNENKKLIRGAGLRHHLSLGVNGNNVNQRRSFRAGKEVWWRLSLGKAAAGFVTVSLSPPFNPRTASIWPQIESLGVASDVLTDI